MRLPLSLRYFMSAQQQLDQRTCVRLISSSATDRSKISPVASSSEYHEKDATVTPDILAKRADPLWRPVYPSPPSRDPIDLTFENYQQCYRSKTTWEIVRALIVLNLCRSTWLVDHNMQLIRLGRKLMGQKMFEFLMKATFYGHFVGGEDPEKIKPIIERMRQFGVKSILDYSAEEDVPSDTAAEQELKIVPENILAEAGNKEDSPVTKQFRVSKEFGDRRRDVISARTYLYENEAQCEKNMATFLKCIDAVSGTTDSTGFAAIKLTALGRPELLMRLSAALIESHRYFNHILGIQSDSPVFNRGTKVEEFKKRLADRGVDLNKQEVSDWLKQVDSNQDGVVDVLSWGDLIDQIGKIENLLKVPMPVNSGVQFKSLIVPFTDEDEEMFHNMMRRLKIITEHAVFKEVRMMIDAEQTYFQPAISRITMEYMRRYNKPKAYIFNTYQCYLKDAYRSVINHLDIARKEDFFFGAKIVRGAYVKQERDRAAALGYPDPINPTYEDTTRMYEKVITTTLEEIKARGVAQRKVAIMMATHNEDSVRFTVNKMAEFGIDPADRVVCFGQLLGMCDQISFNLGQGGYSIYKYVPYGKVMEVLPYLSRRALENKGVLAKTTKERRLLGKELSRRILNGQIFYKPKGDYWPV